ncbi:MAG: PIN domain-containing protein [Deltaproteobacteria bacterium]
MILLDTNVVSEALKPAPAFRVVGWLDEHFPDCAISSLTVFELRAALVLLESGKRKQALEGAIVRSLRRFADRTYAFDAAAAESAATLLAQARSAGLPLGQLPTKLADLQLAGIASAYGLQFATRNVANFRGLGLELLDPWSAEPASPPR